MPPGDSVTTDIPTIVPNNQYVQDQVQQFQQHVAQLGSPVDNYVQGQVQQFQQHAANLTNQLNQTISQVQQKAQSATQPSAGDIAGWRQVIQSQLPEQYRNDADLVNTILAGGYAESGLDPNRVQQGGNGRGFFQFDTGGGMGTGLSPDQLYSEAFQASKIIPQYLHWWQQAPSGLSPAEKASWVAAMAERPYDYQNPNSTARRNYANAYNVVSGANGASTPYQGASGVASQEGADRSGAFPSTAAMGSGATTGQGALDAFAAYAQALGSPVDNVLNQARQTAGNAVQGAETAGQNLLGGAQDLAGQAGQTIASAAQQGGQDLSGTLGSLGQDASNAATSARQTVANVSSDVGNLAQSGVGTLSNVGQAGLSALNQAGQGYTSEVDKLNATIDPNYNPQDAQAREQQAFSNYQNLANWQAGNAANFSQLFQNAVANPALGTAYAGIESLGQRLTGGEQRPFEQNLPSDPAQAAIVLGQRWGQGQDVSQLPANQQGIANVLHTVADFANPAWQALPAPGLSVESAGEAGAARDVNQLAGNGHTTGQPFPAQPVDLSPGELTQFEALRQKAVAGQPLTADEQAFVNDILARRQNGANRPGQAPTPGQVLPAGEVNPRAVKSVQPVDSSNPDIRTLGKAYAGETPAAAPPTLSQRWQTAHDNFVRAWTDNKIDLSNIQSAAAKVAGRPLNAHEMLTELSRLNPDGGAEVALSKGLRPALLSVGSDRPWLSVYLTLTDNLDTAKAVGQKVEEAGLASPLARTVGEKRVASIESQLRMFQRLKAEGEAASDGTAVTHYDEQIGRAQAALSRAQKLAVRQVTKADAARTISAQTAAEQAQANRAFSGGLNLSKSQQALQDLETELGPERFQRIEQAAGQVWNFNHQLLQRKVDAGLITQTLADDLTKTYPHYSPTKITDFLTNRAQSIPRGTGLSVRTTGLHVNTVEGTTAMREDPLASIVRNAYQTEALARKNETFNALVKLRDLDPSLQEAFRPVTSDFVGTTGEAPVSGFVNGERQIFAMPRDLADLIQNQPRAALPGLGRAMGVLRGLMASRNPLFVPTHAMITALPYTLREATREGGPQALPRVITALGSAYVDAFKGLTTGEYGSDTARYLAGGGGMFGTFESSPGGARQSVEDLARSNVLTIQNKGDLRRAVTDVLTGRPVESVINRVDLAPRVAAMKLAEARGANPVQAVTEGRTATIDFSQGGNWAKTVNSLVPFFNVAMQGAAQPARMFRDNPKAAFANAVALLAAPTVAASAWNHADPQRAQDYQDVPAYYKGSGLVVMLPTQAPVDANGNRKPQFIFVPTREFSPFVVGTRAIADRVMGDSPQAWGSLLLGIASGMSPVPTDSVSGAVGHFIPGGPLLSTPLSEVADYNFTSGHHIISKYGDQSASLPARAVATGVDALGANLHPSQVDFALRQFGGPGQLAASVGRPNTGTQPDQTPQDIPIVGPMVSRFVKDSTGQLLANAQGQTISPSTQRILNAAGYTSTINPVTSTIGKVKLTQQEQTFYQQRANTLTDQSIQRLATIPQWNRLSGAQKQDLIKRLITQAHEQARGETLNRMGIDEIKRRVSQRVAANALQNVAVPQR